MLIDISTINYTISMSSTDWLHPFKKWFERTPKDGANKRSVTRLAKHPKPLTIYELSWPPAARICKGSEPDIFQRQGWNLMLRKNLHDRWHDMTFGDQIPTQPLQIQRLLRRSVLSAVSPAMSNSPLLKICRIMHDTKACLKKAKQLHGLPRGW